MNPAKLKTEVGQIYLTHPKDQNYTALYEEAFTRGGETLELFAVLEIDGSQELSASRRTEYEKLAQILVQTLKKTYITEPVIDGDSFEKALAAVNVALMRLARGGKVNWYYKLHIALGTLYKNELSVASCGNAQIFLLRQEGLTALSENLSRDRISPIKIFSNFSTGRLIAGDRVILSTNQLFNYLSIERLQKFLAEDSLEDACQEAIAALAEVKTAGFATFIFEMIGSRAKPSSEEGAGLPVWTEPRSAILAKLAAAGSAAGLSFLKFLWWALKKLGLLLLNLVRPETKRSPRQKKIIAAALGLLLLLLVANLAIAAVRRSLGNRRAGEQSARAAIETKLNDAEAALIYHDDDRAASLIAEAENLLKNFKGEGEQKQSLTTRLAETKSKVSKITTVPSPTVLATFPNIPTDLVHGSQGFLGFNKTTGSLAFYNFTLGETNPVLKGQNGSDLAQAVYLGPGLGFVFLTKTGKFFRLNLSGDTLEAMSPAAEGDSNLAHAKSLAILGEDNSARLYLLGQSQKDIWKVGLADNVPKAAQKWLKAEADFTGAKNLTVDGSIYIGFPDRVDKFFNGAKQSFSLSPVLPPLQNAGKVYTSANLQSLYVLDPANQRIVVFTKAGKLSKQIISPKFNELTDIFVDEPNKLLYVLSGGDLLKIEF